MAAPDREELELLRSQAKRVERESRLLKQMVAKLVDSMAAPTSTAEEAHEQRHRDTD